MPRRAEAPTTDLSAYKAGQVDQIVAWKSKPVNPVAEAWNLTILQAAKVATFLIPDVLVRSAIESSYSAARQLASPGGVARQAGVRDIIASGALLNLSFMRRVDVTARRVFQERWLKENGKIEAPKRSAGRAISGPKFAALPTLV